MSQLRESSPVHYLVPRQPAFVEAELRAEGTRLLFLLHRSRQQLETLWSERSTELLSGSSPKHEIERLDRRFYTELRKLDRLVSRFHLLGGLLPAALHRELTWLFLNLCLGDAAITLRDLDVRSVCAERLSATLLQRDRYEAQVVRLAQEAAGVSAPWSGSTSGERWRKLTQPLAAFEGIFCALDRILRAYHFDDDVSSASVDLVPPCSNDIEADALSLHGAVHSPQSRSIHVRALLGLVEVIRPLFASCAERIWWDHYRPRIVAAAEQHAPEARRQLYLEAILCTKLLPTELESGADTSGCTWVRDAFEHGYNAGAFSDAQWSGSTFTEWDTLWLELWSRVARDLLPMTQRHAWQESLSKQPQEKQQSAREKEQLLLPSIASLSQKIFESLGMPLADFAYARPEDHGFPESMRFAVGSNVPERRIRACTELMVRYIGSGVDPYATNECILTGLRRLLALTDIAIHPNRGGVWAPRFGAFVETLATAMFERVSQQQIHGDSALYDRIADCPQESEHQLSTACVSRIVEMLSETLERALLSANRALASRAQHSLRLMLRMLAPTSDSASSAPHLSLSCTRWARALFESVVLDTFEQESKASRRATAVGVAMILLPYLLPPQDGAHDGRDDELESQVASRESVENRLVLLLDYILEGTSASDAPFAEAAYHFCLRLLDLVHPFMQTEQHASVEVGVFLSRSAYTFLIEEWLYRFAERIFDVLDALEDRDASSPAPSLQVFENLIMRMSEVLQSYEGDTDAADSLWHRLFIEKVLEERLTGHRALDNATKEWSAVVRALVASTDKAPVRRRHALMDRLLATAAADADAAAALTTTSSTTTTTTPPTLQAWRLGLLGQACRRYADASELALRYGDRIAVLIQRACCAVAERSVYKAGGKLLRGLMQGLTDSWPVAVRTKQVPVAERWQRVRTLWRQGCSLSLCIQQISWQHIEIQWHEPCPDAVQYAWSLFAQNLRAIEAFLGDASASIDTNKAKAAARWLFALRRGARWLLSGKRMRSGLDSIGDEMIDNAFNAEDAFDTLDEDLPGAFTDSNDAEPVSDSPRKSPDWTALNGNASGFLDLLPSNATQLLEQWQALVLRIVLAADPDTLQRDALRPLEIGHQGFSIDDAGAQRAGRGRARRRFALRAINESAVDVSGWALLEAPPWSLQAFALAALESRRSLAARAGSFAICCGSIAAAHDDAFPKPLLKVLLSERGVLSDFPGVGRRARALLLPACRFLSLYSLRALVLRPVLHELDAAAAIDDKVLLRQQRTRLESVFLLLDALAPRLASEARLFRELVATVLRTACRGTWMTNLASVYAFAMRLLFKVALRVRRLAMLSSTPPRDERCATLPSIDAGHQLSEGAFSSMLLCVAQRGAYPEPCANVAALTGATQQLAWPTRAVAAWLLIQYDLVREAHWRALGVRDSFSDSVAVSWRRALDAAMSLANDAHHAALRRLGTLLVCRLSACSIARSNALDASWRSAEQVQALLYAMYLDAKGPLSLFISSASSPTDAAAAAAANEGDVLSSLTAAVAQQWTGAAAAAGSIAAGALADVILDAAAASWELLSGGPVWPSIRDGCLGSSLMVSRQPGEHWTFAMLTRVRCLERLHGLMDASERQRVQWYRESAPDLSMLHGTQVVDGDGAADDRLRKLEHEILVATASRDLDRLAQCIEKCPSQLVWRSLIVPALRYLADQPLYSEAELADKQPLIDMVMRSASARVRRAPNAWNALLDETVPHTDATAVVRTLHCLEALGRVAPPASLRYELLMGRLSGVERDAAASLLAVWVANHRSLLTEMLERWRLYVAGLEAAFTSGGVPAQGALPDRLFAARDTLISFLERLCSWRLHDVAAFFQQQPISVIDWCLAQLGTALVFSDDLRGDVSGMPGSTGSAATLGQRESLAQHARNTWYLLAQTRALVLFQRTLYAVAEARRDPRLWPFREAALQAVRLAMNDHPFALVEGATSTAAGTSTSTPALQWIDELLPFLNDTEVAVRKVAAQALAAWSRWFVPHASDHDDERMLHEPVIRTYWCEANDRIDDQGRALVLAALIQYHPYNVRPRWMSDVLHALVRLTEVRSSNRASLHHSTARRREAAQVARQCLQAFRHMHHAQWTREQQQLEPSVREQLADLWLGSAYVV